MKKEIQLMRDFQRKLESLVYPGYPFQTSIVIDLSQGDNGIAWIDAYGRKQKLDNALKNLYARLIYQIVGCSKMTKRTWLRDQNLSEIETIRDCDYDEVYIDEQLVARFYLMLNCAIYSHKQNELDKNPYIFGCVDLDTEYVEVKMFNNLQEIEQYANDYWREA